MKPWLGCLNSLGVSSGKLGSGHLTRWPPLPGSQLYMFSLYLSPDLIRGLRHLYKKIIVVLGHMSQVPGGVPTTWNHEASQLEGVRKDLEDLDRVQGRRALFWVGCCQEVKIVLGLFGILIILFSKVRGRERTTALTHISWDGGIFGDFRGLVNVHVWSVF